MCENFQSWLVSERRAENLKLSGSLGNALVSGCFGAALAFCALLAGGVTAFVFAEQALAPAGAFAPILGGGASSRGRKNKPCRTCT